jgi:hypothetical protein
LSRPSGRLAVVGTLTLGVVVTVTPANGAANEIAKHVENVFRGNAKAAATAQLPVSQSGKTISGPPAVGPLFTSSKNKLGSHFCTASVVNSPHGDLAITAAHCVSGLSGTTIEFVPGYHSGSEPYGQWTVSKIYADQAWTANSSQNDDVAFLRLSPDGTNGPIEDVTGAETLATQTPAKQLVEVIGYPDTANQPIACRNWTSQPMSEQLEFDCAGYTNGTSGGPFLTDVNAATGQGEVVGVIGGYEQGGYTPAVSYSVQFTSNVSALYATAVAGG